jgi:hypothetical protein
MQTIQVEWGESGENDKVLNTADIMAVFSLNVIHCMDEGTCFAHLK